MFGLFHYRKRIQGNRHLTGEARAPRLPIGKAAKCRRARNAAHAGFLERFDSGGFMRGKSVNGIALRNYPAAGVAGRDQEDFGRPVR